MSRLVFVLLASALGMAAQEKPDSPLAVAQKLFDAMHTHDGKAARDLFTPGALLLSVDDSGTLHSLPAAQFADHISSATGVWLERIWNPKVLEQASIAVVWADYDFHLNGKFSHCGVDSFSLVKSSAGWKIAYISDTRKKSECTPSPLGPPKP